jgi:hypothetical protein
MKIDRFRTLAEALNKIYSTKGATRALTDIRKSKDTTDYLQQNEGYGQIVGISFDGSDKVYDYVNPEGTSRVGDHPTVEVTNKLAKRNTFVPGSHTEVVSTAKAGIGQNASRLDAITSRGIKLKTIQSQESLRALTGYKGKLLRPRESRIPSNNNEGANNNE